MSRMLRDGATPRPMAAGRGRRRARGLALGAGLTLLAFAGCDGDNLFEGEKPPIDGGQQPDPPRVVAISFEPDTVQSGGRLDIRVVAQGDLELATLDVQLRRAIDSDTKIELAAGRASVTEDVAITIPDAVADTILIVRVTATDVSGAVSGIVSDTLPVVDRTSPSISAALQGQAFGPGDTVRVLISAADNVALDSVGYEVRLAAGDTITPVSRRLDKVGGSKADTTFVFVVPAGAAPAQLRVYGVARDHAGGMAVSSPAAFGIIDTEAPSVAVALPQAGTHIGPFAAGDSLRVETELGDNAGVVEVTLQGFVFRGDRDLGTFEAVPRTQGKTATFDPAAADTLLVRYLAALDSSEPDTLLHLVVQAKDEAGNVAADTLSVRMGGPRIEILDLVHGQTVAAGRALAVRALAFDAAGLNRIELEYSGVAEGTISRAFTPARTDSLVVDTAVVLAGGLEGDLLLEARAYNIRGEQATFGPITLHVDPSGELDEQLPKGAVVVTGPERMEQTDSVTVRVTASDDISGSGLVRVGVTYRAVNPTRTDTVTRRQEATFSSPRTTTDLRFALAPFNIDPLALPDDLVLEVHGYAVDNAGNCAAFASNQTQSLPCDTTSVTLESGGRAVVAAGIPGRRHATLVVPGWTVLLPEGGKIADAVVDTLRDRLYLSNIDRNSIEVLDLDEFDFDSPVRVGAEPWGMFLNRRSTGVSDTLIVANSLSTNISFLSLDGTPREDAQRRLLTPNAALYEIKENLDETGSFTYEWAVHDFSDRPQFIAQDAEGRLLYSTVPTGSAPDGTLRITYADPVPGRSDDQAEAVILFNRGAVVADTASTAIAYADSVVLHNEVTVQIYDHVFGYPDQLIASVAGTVEAACADIAGKGSDVLCFEGRWDLGAVGMSDTTYIGVSGDREFIAFGEGASAPTGRVMLWSAAATALSNDISVLDLVNNQSDRIFSLDMNEDGTLGLARGSRGAYFFSRNLRLQGGIEGSLGSGVGAALHPRHDESDLLSSSIQSLAFIGGGENNLKVVDTVHFYEVADVQIRDRVVGPLLAVLPDPSDNPGLTCRGRSDDPINCIVVKLYGVTSVGGVVRVDIRRRDLNF